MQLLFSLSVAADLDPLPHVQSVLSSKCMARSILRAFLLAFTKIIMMDMKTITDIVKPIVSALDVAIAPVHLEVITVAAGKYNIAVVVRFN